MFEDLKKDWRILRENPPGRRFQARYRYRTIDAPPSAAGRTARIAIGVALLPVGVFLWFVPGPGWLTIFVGLGLLAGESRRLSRFLDGVELGIRGIIRRLRFHRSHRSRR